MRICDINNFYTPVGGGVRVYHDRKLAYCRDRDIPYCLVVPSDRFERVSEGSALRLHVPSIRLGGSGYRLIVSRRAIRRAVAEFKPDVIEIGSPYVLPLIVPRVASEAGIPTVGFYHADYPDAYVRKITGWVSRGLAGPASRIAGRHVRWAYGRMSAVFGASDYVLEKLYGVGVRRLFRTPLGVDSENFRPERHSDELRESLGAGREVKLVLFLARVSTEKGIDLLMEAYPFFRDPARVQLVIGGHGPYEGHLKPFLEKYPEVRRIPFIADREEVARLMASADVFLSMSNDETFGLAIAEALACGTPVVAPNAGAAAELLTRSNILEPYRARDRGSFVEHVRAALATADRATSGQLREYALGFDWSVSFDRIVHFYRMIIEAHRSDRIERLVPDPPARWSSWTP
ncbi:MAG TPA: glycosyltransferase [Rhodothermales bacterium]